MLFSFSSPEKTKNSSDSYKECSPSDSSKKKPSTPPTLEGKSIKFSK